MEISVSLEAIILGIFLAIAMFGVGAAIDLQQLKLKFKNPKGLIIGFICQYIILPFMAWFYSYIFDLQSVMAVAVIIVGSCPGGIISNYFCLLINADTELSVAMTAFSSLLAFAMIPLNGYIYIQLLWNSADSDGISLDWFGMLLSVIFLLSGLCAGLVVSFLHRSNPEKYTDKLVKICVRIGTLFILCLIAYGLYINLVSDYPIYEYGIYDWLAPSLLCLSSWFFGLLLGRLFRLKQASAVAVAIETSNQNASLGLAILVLTLDGNDDAEQGYGIPIIYTILMYIITPVLMYVFYRLEWVQPRKDKNKNDTSALILLNEMSNDLYTEGDITDTANTQTDVM